MKGTSFQMAAIISISQDYVPVNPEHLTGALRATYELVIRLSRSTGYCYARASWIAEALGISESQLSRRLKQLVKFGLLQIEHLPGLKRLIRPVSFFAPSKQRKCKTDADSLSTTMETAKAETNNRRADPKPVPDPAPSVVVPSATPFQCQKTPEINNTPVPMSESDNPSTDTDTLIEAGVTPVVAAQIAKQNTLDTISAAVAYCRKRGYGPGALVRCLTQGWNVPKPKPRPQEARSVEKRTDRECLPMPKPCEARPPMELLRARLKA